MIILLYSISAIHKKIFTPFRKKNNENKNNKNIFNKSERRYIEVKTQKAGKQGWEANMGPKITSI